MLSASKSGMWIFSVSPASWSLPMRNSLARSSWLAGAVLRCHNVEGDALVIDDLGVGQADVGGLAHLVAHVSGEGEIGRGTPLGHQAS